MGKEKSPTEVEIRSGLTVAILSCLLKTAGSNPLASTDMVDMIRGAGRRTNLQEVSSLLAGIMKSDVGKILQVRKDGRSKLYQIHQDYIGATLDQLQRLYLKRMKFSVGDLRKDLMLENRSEVSAADASPVGENVVLVKGKRVTLILEDRDTEVIIKYR